ncbi:MAG: hypothetical protein ABJQ23_09775 [Shimia thalassica]|uniref:plasmid mobilization protein n=1 Tax=Shimia thalassica TaxID=1715693 RepID=UPI003296FD58
MTQTTLRTTEFKFRLSEEEADILQNNAGDHRLTKADYVRQIVFGPGAKNGLPNGPKLQSIAQKLAGISNNLNQCQAAINSAQANGKLSPDQFAAMHKAISHGLEAWVEPLEELRAEIGKLR